MAESEPRSPLIRQLTLVDLPTEIIVHIIKLLGRSERCALRLCCGSLQKYIDLPAVWRNVHTQLICVKNYNKQVWQLLKSRNLTHLSLLYSTSISTQNLNNLFKITVNLKSLSVSCSTLLRLQNLAAAYLQNLEELSVDLTDCSSRVPGACTETLVHLPWLCSLHLHSVESEEEFATVSQHIHHIDNLQELKVEFANLHNYLEGGSLSGLLHSQPNLQKLELRGMTVVLNSIDAACAGGLDPINNVLLHHKMAKEVSDPQSFFRDLIELQHLESLSLTLPVQACRILMATITESMPNCQNLTLLVVGLPFKPFEFHSLPSTLETFSLRWALGGMINYSRGIVSQFPEQLKHTLRKLDFPQVRLSSRDLDQLADNFTHLQCLSCSLGEQGSGMAPATERQLGESLLLLAKLPKLHTVRLWYFLAEKYTTYAQRLREMSNCRIKVDFTASATNCT